MVRLNILVHDGSRRLQQRVAQIRLGVRVRRTGGLRTVQQHQRVRHDRGLVAADHQLLLAGGELPVDLLQRIALLVGAHVRGAGDVLRGAGHALRAGIPRRVGQRAHVKGQRQHDQLAAAGGGHLLRREHPQQIADDHPLHAGAGDAHMGRVEGQGQALLAAGHAGEGHLLRRTIRPRRHVHRERRDGDQPMVLHRDLQGHVLAALHGLGRQQRRDGQRPRRPPDPQEARPQQQPHQQRRREEHGAPGGKGRHGQRRSDGQRQGEAAVDALFRLRIHHSFTGTGTDLSTFMTTLWAVTPFMRLSGLSTRRWDKTGIAMCCTSSGMM